MKNAIFLSFDDSHFGYAKMCLRSLQANYPNHPIILCYYNGNDFHVMKFLKLIDNIKIFHGRRDFLNLDGINLGVVDSRQVFFRYMLWSNEFDDYDTILHLDVDLVILKPLDEIFQHKEFFAVCDFSPYYSIFKNESYASPALEGLLLNDKIQLRQYPYNMMNAGVFLIPKSYRTNVNFNLLWEITRKYNDHLMFADQSAISLWCFSQNINFSNDIRFNFQCAFFHYPIMSHADFKSIEILRDVFVLHFARYKPDQLLFKRLLNLCQSFVELSKLPELIDFH
ncbi:MAG: hypothetical protein C0490_05255 [Marivirga sp.]|nr:hypothetical protein [Marivirga sp.]